MDDLISREEVLKQITEWIIEGECYYSNATDWLTRRICNIGVRQPTEPIPAVKTYVSKEQNDVH